MTNYITDDTFNFNIKAIPGALAMMGLAVWGAVLKPSSAIVLT